MSKSQTKVSNQTKSRLAGVISGLILATLVLVGNFGGFQTARAVTGEGTATINGTTNVTSEISTSNLYTVVLTVGGATGIALDASDPTFTIPAGFTAPTVEEVNAAAVGANGEWFVATTGATCAVDMVASAAVGQVITAAVTAQCDPGDTITLTYYGASPATAMAPTNFDIQTDDVAPAAGVASITTTPAHTVTVKGTAVVANHLTGAAVGNSLAGLAKIGGVDLVLGGFSVATVGEDVALTTIRTTVTLGTMDIGELTNLRIVEDDGTGGGVANNGTMEAGELAAPLATIASPVSGNNDFTVVDTVAGGFLDNYFIVGTIASTVADQDTIDVEATGAGSVSSGVTSLAPITLTGTSTNNTRTLTDTTAPTLVSAKFTAVNQLTLVFSEPVDAVAGDFTNLETTAAAADLTVLSISAVPATTIVITTNESIITGAMNAGQIDIAGTVNDVSVANNAFAGVLNQAVTDGIAPVISAVTPVTGSSVNAADTVGYSFSEATISGSITFTRTGGSADAQGTHVYSLAGGDLTSGAHTVAISVLNADVGAFALTNALVDGAIYTTTINGTDSAGNAATAVTTLNVTYDTSAPVISAVTPVTGSSNNAADTVGYTFGEAAASGTITFTRTGGSADAVVHTYAITGGDLTAASHTIAISVLNADGGFGGALVDGAIYTTTINATDGAGNAATTITTTNVTYDTSAPVISAVTPVTGSYNNASDTVGYTFGEVAASGTITFTRTGGSADAVVHTYAITGGDLTAASHTIAISVLNADGGFGGALVDGAIYTTTINATDGAGNAATTITTTNVTYDTSAPTGTSAPTAAAGPIINNAEKTATVAVVVGLGTSGAVEGDTLDLLIEGAAFTDTAQTHVLTAGEVIAGTYTFNIPTGADTVDWADATAPTLTGRVTDIAGNVGGPSAALELTIDTTAPTFLTANVQDTGLNGIIDTVAFTFSETMADTAAGANGFNVTSASNHGSCTGESINPTASTSGTLTVTCTGVYTAVGDMNIVVTTDPGLTDTAGNQVATVTLTVAVGAGPAITDNAAPVLMTTSPASAATSVDRQADTVLTFSEPMATDAFTEGAEFDVSNFTGTFAGTWSSLDTVMTLVHADTSYGCSDDITTTLTAAEISAAAGTVTVLSLLGPQDGIWTFTTRNCSTSGGSSSSGSSAAPTYSISVDEPVGGEALDAGDELSIQWTTGGTGAINYVDVSYSTNGSTYTTIADNSSNDGVYLWTIPAGINSDSVTIKVVATDLSDTLDSDTSAEFTIGTPSTTTTDSSTDESVAPEAEGTGDFGYSPMTGELEEISTIVPGDYFRGASYDTVYFLDNDETRRPFMDSQTYFTWHSTFNPVITVTDATLAAYPLGAPMLPQPGVVLIKIVSSADVFALEADPDDSNKVMIRLIPDEATAVAVYGSDWADYVIDIDVTLFARFTQGSAIDDGYSPDLDIMKKRETLN